MRFLFKMMLAPISLFVAFLALMAKWLLTLSSYVVAPLMLYIFGCGIYTVYRQTWDQFSDSAGCRISLLCPFCRRNCNGGGR